MSDRLDQSGTVNGNDLADRHFQHLLESAPDAIVIVDDRGRIVLVNRMTETLFGYHRDELIGRVLEVLLPERFHQAHTEYRDRYFANPWTRRMGETSALYGRRKDGSEFATEISLSPLQHDGGTLVTAVIRDVTTNKQLEDRLRQQAEELARSNKDLEQFAYVASHDLQEPLRMISSYAQLLERRYRDRLDDDAEEFLDYIVDGATRMQELINDLLAYSRVGTRGKPLIPIDANASLERVRRNLANTIEDTGAQVTHDTLPMVYADPVQLDQLFQNLIGNGIKFRGALPPHVHVGVTEKQDRYEIHVGDNGIGIEPQYAERIFLLFQRLHNKREYPGTGIGLALCKKIVERHGGRIWPMSQPGQGTTFCFTLPKQPPASSAHQTST